MCTCTLECKRWLKYSALYPTHVTVPTHRVPLVVEFGWFWEVHLIPAEVVERPLHKDTKVLAVFKQPVPEGMLAEREKEREGWEDDRKG